MLDHVNIENVLFLDIETVPLYGSYEHVPDNFRQLWEHKAAYISKQPEQTADELYRRAGIYAEFGKIVCISVGVVRKTGGSHSLRIKSFAGDDEKKLLEDFISMLNQSFGKPGHLLCAHNGKEFDFPYIARRLLINGLRIPAILNIAGKKPWEVQHLDTMELWKFGDYKNYTSLNLLAAIFDIPTPKDDIDGSMVGDVYWKEKNLPRISTYCQKDVVTTVRLFQKYKGEPLIGDEDVSFAGD